ncbi:hypothetical protein SK88_05774 [Klebsiella oxytoca]|nr:hypothetical protein SK88_05774 [Klebsiella oxytoca]
MTNNQLTRERLEKIKSWRETYGAGSNVMLPAEEAEELARIALAVMDSEPVAMVDIQRGRGDGKKFALCYTSAGHSLPDDVYNLYVAPQQAPEMTAIIERLNFSGYEYEGGEVTPQNAAAVVDILLQQLDDAVQGRNTQPALVVPENCVTAEHRRVIEMLLSVCGAAFELADDSCQQDVDGEDCHVVPDGAFQKLSDALDEIENTLPTEDIDRPDVFLAWSAMPRAALKSILNAGNSPVIPEGYVMVPMRLTAENGAKGVLSGEFSETQFVNCPECFGDDECETCDGSGRIEIKVPVSWTTIKEIWIKGVEHFAAAPQENN